MKYVVSFLCFMAGSILMDLIGQRFGRKGTYVALLGAILIILIAQLQG